MLVLKPIGTIRSPFRERAEAPRQPRAAEGVKGTIELLPGHHFEDALSDLEGWQYIWVIFWFHLNEDWRPKVLPPRSTKKRGLFSTRTPHRPNPLGLSVLKLERVEGLVLHVSDVDLLDQTPILDIKPYVPWTDAIVGAKTGWLEEEGTITEVERVADPLASYGVRFAGHAIEQLAFLRAHAIDLEPTIRRVLALGPHPHAYRRIKLASDGTGVLAVKDWRVKFRSEEREIEVLSVTSGYRKAQLEEDEPERAVHRAFVARWS